MKISISPIKAILLGFFWIGTPAVYAEKIDPNSAEGYVTLNRKIHCSTKDNDPQVYRWFGRGYARVPGTRDKHLFNLDGMNVRQCVTIKDKNRGVGYRMVSREIMLYLDPKTNEVLRQFKNPWTGVSNEVIHVSNDPVNGRKSFGKTEDGKTIPFDLVDINGTYMLKFEVPLFYNNPLGGDYQKYIGGTYHATEIFDFNGQTEQLLDPAKPVDYPIISWVRLGTWLPWMEMGDRPGLLYFNAMGKKLQSFDQLSETLKTEIKNNYPKYTAPPPGDDSRPNETSWTYMKKVIEQRKSGK